MNYKFIFIIFLYFFIVGCEQSKRSKNINLDLDLDLSNRYKNTGFTLVYENSLDIKKEIDDRSLSIFHKSLKKKSSVKITNPTNGKSVIAKVISNKVKFSEFYNSVISLRIAETLEIDFDEPFIEIVLVSADSTFVAKKTKTFEQEKKEAQKAPIDRNKISDLSITKKKVKMKNENKKFSYSIKVADFYYKKTAEIMVDRIKNETSLKNLKIIQLSKTNYRVLIGPFDDINSLRNSFEKMKSLYFENLEVIKNV